MSNLPFGFSAPGEDNSAEGSNSGGATGPTSGGFDLGQLGQVLSQLGQMMSQASATGADTSAGPVNYELARQMATAQVPASHPVSSVDLAAIKDAVALAEVWLDGSTTFPVGARTVTAWTAREWIDKTMPAWQALCSPIAERVSQAWIEGLPAEARAQAGPLLAMMGSMGAMAFGSQLGQGLAQLATEVLTSTDIGLPLGPTGTAALMPKSIAELSASLELGEDEVRLYIAAREAAHHRLFAHTSWIKDRIVELISAYAGAITVDFSAMEELASTIDPSNPASIEAALSQGMFEPSVSADQQQALHALETLLALVEGWVDTVVDQSVGGRLPNSAAMHETMRRRRASGGPAEQTFATLIGLQLRPRRLRSAAELWLGLDASRGTDGRDALWAHPDLLPTSADLDDPKGFLQRDRDFAALLEASGDWDIADIEKPDATEAGDTAPDAQ
ncbi:MAG: zinc-dependent metalloprotease [Nakamurella sp.]